MYRRNTSAIKIGKSDWMPAIRDSAYDCDRVALRHPVRWRLLRRIWVCGEAFPWDRGRWQPFRPFIGRARPF